MNTWRQTTLERRRRPFQFSIAEMLSVTFAFAMFMAMWSHMPLIAALLCFAVASPLLIYLVLVFETIVKIVERWLGSR